MDEMSDLMVYAAVALFGGVIGYLIGYARGDVMSQWARREYTRQLEKARIDAALATPPAEG